MKPIIGLVPRPTINATGRDMFSAYKEIVYLVWNAGGIPIILVPPHIEKLTEKEELDIQKQIDLCDGVIAGGGDDYYDYDLKMIAYAHKKDIPVLGICLGMQTMAMLENGTLEKIGNDSHQKKGIDYAHSVSIKENTKLYDIFKEKEILVNSRHKEIVTSTSLQVNATSKEGFIEGIEDPTKTFFIGVQWHPEDMVAYDIKEKALIETFIEACKR
ncbi:MAG: gamma-glutamyl-gamma-aminobutyrate hydrolase family protein [Bacilli bacterium]|nr:gamma-glutamyl-gamma-aminobutyrate hydrolase family protein [Bacilli bacterium]